MTSYGLYWACWLLLKLVYEDTVRTQQKTYDSKLYNCSKIWGQEDFFLIYTNTFIQQGSIKIIKGDSKHMHNVIKDFYYFNQSFELSIYQGILKM